MELLVDEVAGEGVAHLVGDVDGPACVLVSDGGRKLEHINGTATVRKEREDRESTP